MPFEIFLLLLCLIFSLAFLTAMFLYLRIAQRSLSELAALHKEALLLLSSKDVLAYEQLKVASTPLTPAYPEASYYYTGDERQVADQKFNGSLNDDELTALVEELG